MLRTYVAAVCLLFGLVAFGCGEKDATRIELNFTFTGANPFEMANLEDIIFRVVDLDSNNTEFIFPIDCVDQSLAADCGFQPEDSNFELQLEFSQIAEVP